MADKLDPIGYAKYIRNQRSTEQLLRQFLKLESGLGNNPAYSRGYTYAFQWPEEKKAEVNKLMSEGLSFEEAFDRVNAGP